MKTINVVIACATEGCKETFIKMCGPHQYCKKCRLDRKRKASRDWQREKTRRNPVLWVENVCAAEGCVKTFMKNSAWHVYCKECAVKRASSLKTEDSRKRRKEKPEGTKKYMREWARNNNEKVKLIVLTRYGKNGKLLCSEKSCAVSDIDMLSIDHINNDGNKDRATGLRGGQEMYKRLRRLEFPPGYQTLCFNHQFKKAILIKRMDRIPC